jgi:hypothetical protein
MAKPQPLAQTEPPDLVVPPLAERPSAETMEPADSPLAAPLSAEPINPAQPPSAEHNDPAEPPAPEPIDLVNSLDLDCDVHGATVLRDLELAFGVDLLEEAANRWVTAGDIYESLRRLLHEGGKGNKLCATAMAQYRLRLALLQLDPEARPIATDSLQIWKRCTTRRLLRQLGRRTRLVMPGHRFSWAGIAGLVLVPVAVCGLLVAVYDSGLWLIPAGGLLLAALLVIFDPGRLPKAYATLGGLSRQVAALNFRQFARMGAERRDKEIWAALAELLSEHSALPLEEIRPDTLLVHDPARNLETL